MIYLADFFLIRFCCMVTSYVGAHKNVVKMSGSSCVWYSWPACRGLVCQTCVCRHTLLTSLQLWPQLSSSTLHQEGPAVSGSPQLLPRCNTHKDKHTDAEHILYLWYLYMSFVSDAVEMYFSQMFLPSHYWKCVTEIYREWWTDCTDLCSTSLNRCFLAPRLVPPPTALFSW